MFPMFDITDDSADYRAIFQSAVALKAFANNLAGQQERGESGNSGLDFVLTLDGGEDGVKKALIFQTLYSEGSTKLCLADLGNELLDAAFPLDKHFENFLHRKGALFKQGETLQHFVLFTNRKVSDDLVLLFEEVPKRDLGFPLNKLLEMPSCDCQKFYKFRRPNWNDVGLFDSQPQIGNGYVDWWLDIANSRQSENVNWLKSLIFAVEQPCADELLYIQAESVSGLEMLKNVPEDDRNLTVQIFHDSFRRWMEAKKSERGSVWTNNETWMCLRGAIERVALCLQNGPNCSALAKLYEDILVKAILVGHARAVKILLHKGSNVNTTWRQGKTLLHVAVSKGHLAVAELLLEHGCNPNLGQLKTNQRPLHMAAEEGRLDLVQLLIEKGCDLNAQTDMKMTALHFAAREGHLDVARLLHKHGCDLNARSSWEQTALFFATKGGHLDMVKFLIDMGCPVNEYSPGQTPLHVAASTGRDDLVRLLVLSGCNADVAVSIYGTPLRQAALHGHPEVVRVLLRHGCDVNLACEDKCTPMHSAAFAGNVQIVKMLRVYGADLNAKDSHGRTPILTAALFGKSNVVNYLSTANCFVPI